MRFCGRILTDAIPLLAAWKTGPLTGHNPFDMRDRLP